MRWVWPPSTFHFLLCWEALDIGGISRCIQSAASTRWFYLTAYSPLLLRQYPLEEMLATANFGFTKSSRQSQACPGIWTLGGEGCYKIHENMHCLRNVYIKMCYHSGLFLRKLCSLTNVPLFYVLVFLCYSDDMLFCEVAADSG